MSFQTCWDQYMSYVENDNFYDLISEISLDWKNILSYPHRKGWGFMKISLKIMEHLDTWKKGVAWNSVKSAWSSVNAQVYPWMHKFTREIGPRFMFLCLVTCVIIFDITCRVLKRFGVAHQTNTKVEADEMQLTEYVSEILCLISEFLK